MSINSKEELLREVELLRGTILEEVESIKGLEKDITVKKQNQINQINLLNFLQVQLEELKQYT